MAAHMAANAQQRHKARASSPKISATSPVSVTPPPIPAKSLSKGTPTHDSEETLSEVKSELSSKPQEVLSSVGRRIGIDMNTLMGLSGGIMREQTEKPMTRAERFVISSPFQFFVLSFVLLNSLQLGLSVQYPYEPWKSLWSALEHVFTAVFAIEMVIKLFCLKWKYFREMWNIADFFLAWLSILDNWILTPTVGSEKMSQFTACRMLRVMRVMRMIKVLRVKRELLVLVEGMVASLKGMFWVSMLLFLFVYAGAIVFNMLIVGQETEYPASFKAEYYFGDLWSAMLALFGIIIGAEWTKFIEPLSDSHRRGVVMCFIIFFFIGAFGFLNIIIGVIVDNTNEAASKRDKEDEELHKRKQMAKVGRMVGKLDEFDFNDDGTLDTNDFENIISKDPNFRDILLDLNMPLGFTIQDLQVMLDEDMDGDIKHREFLQGLQRLIYCNEFQHICLAKLERARILQCVKEISANVKKYKQEISKNIESAVDKAVHDLRQEIRAIHTGAPPPPSTPFAPPPGREDLNSKDQGAAATDQVYPATLPLPASAAPTPLARSEAARDAFDPRPPELLPPGHSFVALSIEPLPAAEETLLYPARLTADVAYDDKMYAPLRDNGVANQRSPHNNQAERGAPPDAGHAKLKLLPQFDFQSPYQGVEGLNAQSLRSSGRVDAVQDDGGYFRALPDVLPEKVSLHAVTAAEQPIVTYWC